MAELIYSLEEYKLLAGILGFLFIIIETFMPVLPLSVIIALNAFTLGMWLGFFVSWVGSSLGSILLFILASKFSEAKFFQKFKNEKTNKFINWIKKQGFEMTFITYVCPFIPDFLITITSGFAKMNIKNFIPGMISGKFVMFLFISYIGHDMKSFFSNPLKVAIFTLIIGMAWITGKQVNKRIIQK